MDISLILAFACALTFGYLAFPVLIRAGLRFNLVDIPSSRRRHARKTPIIGGVGVFFTGSVGVCAYALLRPDWFHQHATSIAVMGAATLCLLVIGLLDDLRGLSPRWKLLAEFLIAGAVLAWEPQIHSACVGVINQAPPFLQPVLWGFALVWIVGAANAVNLVDGIDGFAGGVSLLAMVTVFFLHLISGGQNTFMPAMLVFCLAGLIGFLRQNWHPAKIFLGDNGSLTLGFWIAAGGLVPTSGTDALTTAGSLLILLAYPILDMSLCVFRRFRSGYPIFKADRSHLHHRVQRLGLNVPQTTLLLLCAVAYFQISALIVHLVHARLALLVAVAALQGLFTLLYLIRCLESLQRQNLLNRSVARADSATDSYLSDDFATVLQIDLRPLLEVGLWEERARAEALVSELMASLAGAVRAADHLVVSDQKVKIYLEGGIKAWENRNLVETRLKLKLMAFKEAFHLQYSLDGLPLETRVRLPSPSSERLAS